MLRGKTKRTQPPLEQKALKQNLQVSQIQSVIRRVRLLSEGCLGLLEKGPLFVATEFCLFLKTSSYYAVRTKPWLALKSQSRPGWPEIQRFTCWYFALALKANTTTPSCLRGVNPPSQTACQPEESTIFLKKYLYFKMRPFICICI